MAKKPISQKRAEREKQENQTLQRVFNVFLLGIAAECYLFVVYRNYVMGTAASLLVWHSVLRWAAILGVVLLAAGAAGAAPLSPLPGRGFICRSSSAPGAPWRRYRP